MRREIGHTSFLDAARESEVPIVYVYLGGSLPSYARHSLALARRNHRGPVRLLTDSERVQKLPGVEVQNIGSWYDRNRFLEFRRRSRLDPLFRKGFWLHAVERFFVLEQYMRQASDHKIFHAELDVLLFHPSRIVAALDQHGRGLFAPNESPSLAVGSLVYINDAKALSIFLDFAIQNSELGSEMSLLGHFLKIHPEIAHAMPSEHVFNYSKWPYVLSTVASEEFIADCASVGQWMLGQDPRNIQGTNWNHFIGREKLDFNHFELSASFFGGRMKVRKRGENWRDVVALHVHSKIFRRLRIYSVLAFYAWITQAQFRVPISGISAGVLAWLVKHSLSSKPHKLPRIVRNLFGFFLVGLIRSSPLVMSNRQRRNFLEFLPSPVGTKRGIGPEANCVSELRVSLPDRWKIQSNLVNEQLRQDIELEMSIFVDALQRDEPVFYYNQSQVRDWKLPKLNYDTRLPLFVSEKKSYEASRHALAYWSDLNLNNRLSFATDYQLIESEIVRQMFPNGEDDIAKWALLAVNSPGAYASAFQSYGTWLWSVKARSVKLYAPKFLGPLDP